MSKLREILDIVNATDEGAFDELASLMSPEGNTRDSASETLEELLGWDPMSHFDIVDIGKKIEKLINDKYTPVDVVEYLKENKDEVIQDCYQEFDELRDINLDTAIANVISSKCDWDPDRLQSDEDFDDDDNEDDDFDDTMSSFEDDDEDEDDED